MERSTTTAATLQVGVLASALAAAAYLYYRWLNLPITFEIPEPGPTPSAGFDALTAATDLLVDEASLAAALAKRTDGGERLYTIEEKEAVLAANAAALRAARDAFPQEYWNPASAAEGNGYHLAFAKFRSLTFLFALDSQVKTIRGDFGGAVDASIDAVELAVKMARGGPLIPEIIGITCESHGAYPMWRLIDKLDAPSAASAAARLKGVMAQRYPFADMLRIDKRHGQVNLIKQFHDKSTFAALNDLLNSFTLPDDTGQGETSNSSRNQRFRLPVWGLLWIHSSLILHSKRRIFADYSTMMDAFIQQAERPYIARGSEVRIPADTFNQMNGPLIRYPRFRRLETCMNGGLLVCALALRAYSLQHGEYPGALSDLTDTGLLESLPEDPFAQTFGTAFRYRRLSAKSYLLYSVGPDGIDDGGKPIDLASKPDSWRRRLEVTDKGDWVVGVNIGAATGAAQRR